MMTSVLILTICGLLIGLSIALVVRYFGVPSNPLQEKIAELMPGANCGACGFAGCNAYATAMAERKAKPGSCPSMKPETMEEISRLLGVQAEVKIPKVAVVCCSGDDDMATRQAFYNGVNNCRDAMLVAAGTKTCTYGCLGLGACANACPFGAIEITPKHLAVVHPDLCMGCGKCVQTCPKKIIKLVPRNAEIHVFCSSPLKGAEKRKACKAACIGCKMCQKTAGEDKILMNGNLAVINYKNPPEAAVALKCPTHALRSNIPSAK